MATRSLSLPRPPAGAVFAGAAGVGLAAVAGVAIGIDAPVGFGLVLGACFAPIALLNLQLGLALWIPLIFLDGIPALNLAGKAGGLLLLGAWLGALRSGAASTAVLRDHRRVVEALIVLNVWLTVSLLWAEDPSRALEDVWHWWAVSLVFGIVATTVRTERAFGWVAVAFVGGAVASVLAGVLEGDLTNAAAAEARLGGATDDPNFLAAGLVAGVIIAAAVLVSARDPVARLALVMSVVLMAFGVVATQSRGGLLAGLASALAAIVVFRRRRIHAIAVTLLAVGAAGLAFAATPDAWERVSNFDAGGSGRKDLWTVAWRIFEDHPIQGVGINNFGAVTPDYVRVSGTLERVDIVAENPHFVHNVYLQMLAETGLVGLLLLCAFALGCVAAAYRAGRAFGRRGEGRMEALAHAVVVASVGQLVAGFFISSTVDRRLWVLLALGPALALAARHPRDKPAPT